MSSISCLDLIFYDGNDLSYYQKVHPKCTNISHYRRFLLGLQWYDGVGHWNDISRDFVITKTPAQVYNHAQKYFRRLERTSTNHGTNSQMQGNLVG
jgi:hypothetical protein